MYMRKETLQLLIQGSLSFLSILLMLTTPDIAYAGNTGLPWEEPLEQLKNSITGPVAVTIAIVAIAITGLALAVGEASGFVRRALQIVFGISISFAAANVVVEFFKFSGGAVIG